MIRLNLLPDVKLEYLKTKRIHAQVMSIATIVTIAAVGLVVLLAFWVFAGQAFQKSSLTTQIEKNADKLRAVQDVDKYLTLQSQLASLTALHEGKNNFSRLLSFLPVLTPAAPHDVTYSNVEISADGELGNSLIMQGEVKDYTGLATFRDTLVNAKLKSSDGTEEKLFESVTVASSAIAQSIKGGTIVTFRIETQYNPNAFLASFKNPTVAVPTLTTTQSAQASPNVFSKSSVEEEQ